MKRSVSSTRKAKLAAVSPPQVEEAAVGEQDNNNVVTSYRWAWYALALLVPFAGIFVAIFLYGQESREVRMVGRNCLIIGFLFWVVFPLFVALTFLLLTVLVGFQIISDVMPTWY
jgi:hypothetical protein